MVQGSLMVTTKDLQASIDGVDTAILNFDVKTYIEEAVDNRCIPILDTCKKYDYELQDWKKGYGKFRIFYEKDKENLKLMIQQCVLKYDFMNSWDKFEKKYEKDIANITQDLYRCMMRLDK